MPRNQIYSALLVVALAAPLCAAADNGGTSSKAEPQPAASEPASDERKDFEGNFFVGVSIDSFAANQAKNYIGYTAADSGTKTGYAAGIDFGFRFFKRNPESRWPVQLWVFGETIHGQRSTEVNCQQAQGGQASEAPPVCQGYSATTAPDAFLAVLRNSSSLEAYSGLRLEFLKFNPGGEHSANLYVKSQLGFVTVQNNGEDIVDSHTKLAVGTIMTNGDFRGSYLEAGWGRSDLFALHRGRRFKVDGYVQWCTKPAAGKVSICPFFEMTVDSDLGRGSDDVRTYYGINLNLQQLGSLFGK